MEPLTRALTVSSAAALAAVGCFGYATWEARQYTLRTANLRPRREMERPAPLRVLHLSDLHLSPKDSDRIEWIRDLGRLQPDLTVVTGDFLGDQKGPALALGALEPLLSGPGVFVRGSNDYYAPGRANPLRYFTGPSKVHPRRSRIVGNALTKGLVAAGWKDLDNRSASLDVRGWRISARGVDDPHIRADRYSSVSGPYPPEAHLRLAVTHAPYRRVLDAMAADAADVILAGHTHGGQICIPFLGALVTNCDLPRAAAKGMSAWEDSLLHVSAGLGTSPYARIRFACRPEATLLTIS